MKKIILNVCPPAEIKMPSPPFSNLKAYLNKYGNYKNNIIIIYWNLLFSEMIKEFTFYNNLESRGFRENYLLFLNYIAIEKNDLLLGSHVKAILHSLVPHYREPNSKFYEEHMYQFKTKMDNLLDETVTKFNLNECIYFAFTLKLNQNLFAAILGAYYKKKFPNIPIIVGGISCSKNAKIILENFSQFDIAIWGEGEIPLLKATKELEKRQNRNFHVIERCAFRENNEFFLSKTHTNHYTNLSDPNLLPDYEDYFDQSTLVNNRIIPIEFSRGCHWNKCHFCYLNIGYKYRQKKIQKSKYEIIYMIEKFKIYSFFILDNDAVGKNLDEFELYLNMLKEIKNTHPQFMIINAEVITRGLTKKHIEKMADAGFCSVQIGYESCSDNLLKKIEKKNSFASNLFFIKYALLYGIRITQLNVLTNLIEENSSDVLEAIDNLKFHRFFRKSGVIKHSLIHLCINKTSKYYLKKGEKINLSNWAPIPPYYTFLKNYINDDFKWYNFEHIQVNTNPQWKSFKLIEEYYCTHIHTYKVYRENNKLNYCEYVNGKNILNYDFLIDSLEVTILSFVNDKNCSFSELYEAINLEERKFDKNTIIEKLALLFNLGINFHSKDLKEIVSIIDIGSLDY